MDLYSTARRLARPFVFGEARARELPIGARGIIGGGLTCALARAADPLALGRRSTSPAKDAQGRVERDWGIDYKQRLKQFGPRMLTMGCLALDEGEAEITRDP